MDNIHFICRFLRIKFGSYEYISIFVGNNQNKHKMSDREIILGLMLKLEDENINVSALAKRIGYKTYKKWQKAHDAAFDILEEERK